MENLAVDVKDSPFDPDNPTREIRVRNPQAEQPLYQVFVYLDGPGLPFVDSVTYELHRTFDSPVRRVSRSLGNPRCKLEIWTWGLFEVKATILDKSQGQHLRSHQLAYDRHFSEKDVKFRAG
jgi:transcription initiation factor IIF auxiliary subunit